MHCPPNRLPSQVALEFGRRGAGAWKTVQPILDPILDVARIARSTKQAANRFVTDAAIELTQRQRFGARGDRAVVETGDHCSTFEPFKLELLRLHSVSIEGFLRDQISHRCKRISYSLPMHGLLRNSGRSGHRRLNSCRPVGRVGSALRRRDRYATAGGRRA
jgi:hypothetical protein